MRVCLDCGKENVAHLPRKIDGYGVCPHEYEDMIAGLKLELKNCLKPSEYQDMLKAAQERNATINRRNQQIKDLKKQVNDLRIRGGT